MAEVSGGNVLGALGAAVLLPVTNEAAGQMGFAGAAGAEEHEDGRRQTDLIAAASLADVVDCMSALIAPATSSVFGAGDKGGQRFAHRTASGRHIWHRQNAPG